MVSPSSKSAPTSCTGSDVTLPVAASAPTATHPEHVTPAAVPRPQPEPPPESTQPEHMPPEHVPVSYTHLTLPTILLV
eukprot:4053344-Amphidinium_carterae.1